MASKIFCILRDIRISKINFPITRSEIAKLINLSVYNIELKRAINLMIENRIAFSVLGDRADKKPIKINNDLLEKYIRRNCPEFKKWGRFIEVTKPFEFNY